MQNFDFKEWLLNQGFIYQYYRFVRDWRHICKGVLWCYIMNKSNMFHVVSQSILVGHKFTKIPITVIPESENEAIELFTKHGIDLK